MEKRRYIKQEWEEDFRGFLDFVIEDDSNKKEVVEKVKQLLLEKEKEAVLKYILSLGWQDTDNEYVKEVLEDAEKITSELSKLTIK